MEYSIVLGIIFLGFIFISVQNNKNKDNPEYKRKFKVIDEDHETSIVFSDIQTDPSNINVPSNVNYDS
ncbi:MAG: hypothetical protein GY714_09640 [Desulfobacterales bacterium]|nr:hypothetical protein [Desulfobacterales bacterium]